MSCTYDNCNHHMSSPAPSSLLVVPVTEVFTPDELTTITTCWDESKPIGKFIEDRHGFTHYSLNGEGPMVALCHGLGRPSASRVLSIEI